VGREGEIIGKSGFKNGYGGRKLSEGERGYSLF